MPQLTDKKNKIIIYLLFLIILSTTSGKIKENQNRYFSKINQINIEGLSNTYDTKIINELNYLFYKNFQRAMYQKSENLYLNTWLNLNKN